jgi:hypothetical protein
MCHGWYAAVRARPSASFEHAMGSFTLPAEVLNFRISFLVSAGVAATMRTGTFLRRHAAGKYRFFSSFSAAELKV